MLVDDLKTLLATSYSYALKAANYHWNVEGDDFIQYHSWLGDVYSEVFSSVDQIAEYIRILQAYTPASLIRFQELTRIQDQIEVIQPPELFQQLLEDTTTMIAVLNQVFASATRENQQGIANFMAERLDVMQKYAWQIRSTLKKLPGDPD